MSLLGLVGFVRLGLVRFVSLLGFVGFVRLGLVRFVSFLRLLRLAKC